MDEAVIRLQGEADHLVRWAEWLRERGLPDNTYAAGRCMKCRGWIFATNARDWSLAVRNPCPHCGSGSW